MSQAAIATITSTLDRWIVKLVLGLRWRKRPAVMAKRIRDFEATEDDSAWQLLHAATRLQDGKLKAKLFLQAMEETHHAEVFRSLYRHQTGKKLDKVKVPRKPLLIPGQEWKLFAYCAVGEKAAAQRFRHIAGELDAGPFRSSLQKILEEEEGHIELAGELGALTGRTREEIHSEMRLVKLTRAWESWMRIGRGVTSVISKGLLSLTYYTTGWWLK